MSRKQLPTTGRGIMNNGITILGTWPLKSLSEGQEVYLSVASNQPNGGYYAWPVSGRWEGQTRKRLSLANSDDAILIDADDVTVLPRAGHFTPEAGFIL